MKFDYSKMSQEELIIKILEFVCQNKTKSIIPAALVKRDLFTNLSKDDILDLFEAIAQKKISQITIVRANHLGLKYRPGLEDFIKNYKKMTKKEKVHRILEFVCSENDRTRKSGFDSEEISKAFTPELDTYEVNILCKILIDNGDVKDCTTMDEARKRLVAILVINATHEAYHTKKYLEDEEPFSIPLNRNIITGDNIIIGNVGGDVKQTDNTTKETTQKEQKEQKDKNNWLKLLYWVVGILVGITVIITFVLRLLK